MKQTSIRYEIIVLTAIILISLIAGLIMQPSPIDNYVQYDCDVKSISLSTNIKISSNNKTFGTVSGNIFRLVEDPLTMTDSEGNKMAYAGDDYHFIAQDSHAIIVGDTIVAEMVGLFDLWGNSYNIYDTEGNQIAHAKFNSMNTGGELYDAAGKLVATYSSFVFFNDFTVKISAECEFDPTTVLMIICSYYSDQSYDN